MEKRLIDTYDHMTMPDDCARRIESRLQAELEARETGRYTQMAAPYVPRRGRWIAGVVGMVLLLVVGTGALSLWAARDVAEVPTQLGTEEIPSVTIPEAQGMVLQRMADGNYAVAEYAGKEEVFTIPASTSEVVVTTIGTGEPVISHGDCVEAIWIPETVQIVQENAFANCPALKSVYFEGDAPPEAEDVFEGSGNVYVYYQSGKEGWGDTWCGRETREYSHHVSLGTATVKDRIPASFYDNKGELAIQEYCTAMWDEGVQPKAFAVVDMDRDGVCELVLAPENADGSHYSYLMLSDDGTGICAYTLWGRDIRKDGTFYSFSAKENARLKPRDTIGYTVEPVYFRQQDRPLAQWHIYPCDGFDAVLQSYCYASETGISTYPGNPYVYFEQLSCNEMDNDWNRIQQWLSWEGVCVVNKDMFYAYDPDAPGCVFYGTVTGEGEVRKISSMGYYVCDETGEKRAEVWDLDQPEPVYTVDAPPNDRGREVETAEEMLAYLDLTPFYGEILRDAQKIAELLEWFVHRYSEHDVKGMTEYMAEDVGTLISYPFTGQVSIVTYGVLPDTSMAVGETWPTTLELLESGTLRANYHLDVILVKEADGWKIQSYSIEKQ